MLERPLLSDAKADVTETHEDLHNLESMSAVPTRNTRLYDTLLAEHRVLWKRALPYLVVLGPLALNFIRLGFLSSTAPIIGCTRRLNSGTTFNAPIGDCVTANGNSTLVDVPGLFYSSSYAQSYFGFQSIIYFAAFFSVVRLLQLSHKRGLVLLSYGIFITKANKPMLPITIGAVLLILVSTGAELFLRMFQLALLSHQDRACEPYMDSAYATWCYRAELAHTLLGTGASEILLLFITQLLQYSGFLAFLYQRFADIYAGPSMRDLVKPSTGSSHGGCGLPPVRFKVTATHIQETVTEYLKKQAGSAVKGGLLAWFHLNFSGTYYFIADRAVVDDLVGELAAAGRLEPVKAADSVAVDDELSS